MNATIDEIRECLKRGSAKKVEELTFFALSEGINPREIMEKGLLSGMEQVSARFKTEEVAIAEILSIMRALNSGMDVLKKQAKREALPKYPTVILAGAKENYQDIGNRVIEMMLSSQKIPVINLRADIPAAKFVDCAISKKAKIICFSAELEIQDMKAIVDELKKRGIRGQFYIMLEGSSGNTEIAGNIGADSYVADVSECTKKIKAHYRK